MSTKAKEYYAYANRGHVTFASRGIFASWTFASRNFCLPWKKELSPPALGLSPPGSFASRNICLPEHLTSGTFASWNFCLPEILSPETFASRYFCLLELFPPVTFASRIFCLQFFCLSVLYLLGTFSFQNMTLFFIFFPIILDLKNVNKIRPLVLNNDVIE